MSRYIYYWKWNSKHFSSTGGLKHTHTHTQIRVCHTLSHIIAWDNASSKCNPSAPLRPPPPLISSLPLLSTCSASPLPVTQQPCPVNPFWKETTEQKITSPPLSHTPSFPFVFSRGLPLTSLQQQQRRGGVLPPPSHSVPPDSVFTSSYSCLFLYKHSWIILLLLLSSLGFFLRLLEINFFKHITPTRSHLSLPECNTSCDQQMHNLCPDLTSEIRTKFYSTNCWNMKTETK